MNSQRWSLTPLTKASVLIALVAWSIFFSLTTAIDVPTMHLDGAFQTAAGLFRLKSGQTIGEDFFPYLGIGPLYLLYPLFKLSGSHLAASAFSAQLLSLWGGVLMATFIWHSISGTQRLFNSLVAGVIIALLPHFLSFHFSLPLPVPLGYSASPGNSLRPIRSLLPFLSALALVLIAEKFNSAYFKSLLAGFLVGVGMLWSNDYAIPTAGLLLVTAFWFLWHEKQLNVLSASLLLSSSLIMWLSLLAVATNGHFVSLFHYNFVSVARDQWWYFAPYSESSRVFSVVHLAHIILDEQAYLPIFVLSIVAFHFIKHPELRTAALFFTGLTLFVSSILATTGGHAGMYFVGFSYWGVLVLITEVVIVVRRRMPVKAQKAEGLIKSAVLIACLLISVKSGTFYFSRASNAATDPERFYVPELGGFLPRSWEDYVTFARTHRSDPIIEEYWGIWSAVNQQLPLWPVDSVIHALGSIRPRAEEQLDNAQWIVSTRHITSPEWQPWNLSQNYWFYRKLFQSFTPIRLSPSTILWERKTAAGPAEHSIKCSVNDDRDGLQLDAPSAGFYEVEARYQVGGAGRILILLQNHISYAMDADGHISLNPIEKNVIFPTYLEKAGLQELRSTVIGSSKAWITFESCRARSLSFHYPDALQVPGEIQSAYFRTDKLWNRGLARNWAGFYIPNAAPYKTPYKEGRTILLNDGSRRKIVKLQQVGEYLAVFLNGDPLDPNLVGLPSNFKAID